MTRASERAGIRTRRRVRSTPWSLSRRLAALTAAKWSARAVKNGAAAAVSLRDSLRPEERMAWLSGLRTCVTRHGGALDPDTLDRLLTLAADWGDWRLALCIGGLLEAAGPLRVEQNARLVDVLVKMGEIAAATDRCRRAMFTDPGDLWAERTYHHLMHCETPVVAEDEEVRLVRLSAHHGSDVAWQYMDPEMLELCNLSEFRDAQHWREWLHEHEAAEDQIAVAVVHREWGFIGVVDLYIEADVGFFYYWIGRDFRGCGFGPRAARLLLDTAAQHWGMRACFASVYEHNHPSRSGLVKAGFRQVDLELRSMSTRKLAYYRGPDHDMAVIYQDATLVFEDDLEDGNDLRGAHPSGASHPIAVGRAACVREGRMEVCA